MEQETLEKQLEEVRGELRETNWAAQYQPQWVKGILNYQKKCLGRILDRTKYDIRKYG